MPFADAALSAAAEELSRQLARAEEMLIRRNFGVTAAVELPTGAQLRFGKVNGKWTLAVLTGADAIQPITTSSIEQRAAAAEALPALLLDLATKASKRAAEIRAIARGLESWLDGQEQWEIDNG